MFCPVDLSKWKDPRDLGQASGLGTNMQALCKNLLGAACSGWRILVQADGWVSCLSSELRCCGQGARGFCQFSKMLDLDMYVTKARMESPLQSSFAGPSPASQNQSNAARILGRSKSMTQFAGWEVPAGLHDGPLGLSHWPHLVGHVHDDRRGSSREPGATHQRLASGEGTW